VKRYLFFLRHFNDIDNIAPAIYFFLNDDLNNKADVIIYHEYDYRNDLNLVYLKQIYGERFTCKWLGSYFELDEAKKNSILAQNMQYNWFILLYAKINKLLGNAPSLFYNYCKLLFAGRKTANSDSCKYGIHDICMGEKISETVLLDKMRIILEEHEWPTLVVFDVNRSEQLKGLLNALRQNGIKKIVCLPVSPLISYNMLRAVWDVDVESSYFKKNHNYNGIDYIGYVDSFYLDSYKKIHNLLGRESTLMNKTKTLGSIRFCPKWIEIRDSFIKPFELDAKDKIKMVFFLSHPNSNVFWEEVERTIRMISLYSEKYCLVVKSHTRYDGCADASTLIIDGNNIDSSALINWADTVLFWGTSIAVEGYIKNKTMVCLSYLACNRNLYEKFNAGYIARCRDDLLEFLIKYNGQRDSINYNSEGGSSLVNDVVVPGADEVIVNYLYFMLENEST